MKKSKILIFSDCPFFGGCENVITTILKSPIIRNKYELHFAYRYSKKYQSGLDTRFEDTSNHHPLHLLGVDSLFHDIDRIFGQKIWLRRIVKIPFFLIKKTGIFALINYFKLKRFFRKIQPDILYINNGGYPAARNCITAVFSAKHVGISTIYFNVNNLALKPVDVLSKKRDRYIENYVNSFITASYAAKKRLSEARSFDLNQITTIPNTIPNISVPNSKLKNQYQVHDEVIIGGVGLLTYRKGFHILIEAVTKINTKVPFKVFIFGEGEDLSKLKKQVSKYNLEKHIVLAGFKSNIFDYIIDFDIFVLPSIENEDFPYAIIEAMAMAKPVVSTDVAGIPEAVQNDCTGFVVPSNNSTQLAVKLEQLINDATKRNKFAENGYKRFVENYQYDIVCEKYLTLFDNS